MAEGTLFELQEKLHKTDTPHLILAAIFREVFERGLLKSEWPLLRKFIKLYGRWIVLESFLRASSNVNLDTDKNIFPYLSVICSSMFKEQKDKLDSGDAYQTLRENTESLVKNLFEAAKLIRTQEPKNG